MTLPLRQVLVGDCRSVLTQIPDDSLDAEVDDPPYEINIGGAAWDRTGVAFDVATWREHFRVLKPGAHLVAFGGSRMHHRVWCAIEDAGFEIRDTLIWAHAQSLAHASDLSKVFEENSEEAKAWEGWMSRLRPAIEPICLARKPFKGTLADNIRRYGTGALNVEACRNPIPPGDRPGDAGPDGRYLAGSRGEGHVDGMRHGRVYTPHKDGRIPTNFLLSHAEDCVENGPCVEGCPVAEIDAQSGMQRDGTAVRHRGSSFDPEDTTWGKLGFKAPGTPDMTYGSVGGASRFYPVFRYIAKPGRTERDMGLPGRNPHKTVKPLSLMRWLVRLVTPARGVVLDAFCGSGTTLGAAELEERQWIGIDLAAENAEVARSRAFACAELAGRVTAEQAAASSRIGVQVGLFG